MATISTTPFKVGDTVRIPNSPYAGSHKVIWVSVEHKMLTAQTGYGPVTASFDCVKR